MTTAVVAYQEGLQLWSQSDVRASLVEGRLAP